MPWSDVFADTPVLGDPNTPLVTVDDFVEWFGVDATSTTVQNRIQTALEIASATVRNNRRVFSPISGEVITIDAYGGQTLLLPKNRLPVTDVQLVEQLNGADYDDVDVSLYSWSADGYLTKTWSSWWPCLNQGVRVTYSHGYSVLPRDVAGVCLSLAKRLYDNPSNVSVQSEQLGDHHVTYLGGTGGLSSEEASVLTAYESIA